MVALGFIAGFLEWLASEEVCRTSEVLESAATSLALIGGFILAWWKLGWAKDEPMAAQHRRAAHRFVMAVNRLNDAFRVLRVRGGGGYPPSETYTSEEVPDGTRRLVHRYDVLMEQLTTLEEASEEAEVFWYEDVSELKVTIRKCIFGLAGAINEYCYAERMDRDQGSRGILADLRKEIFESPGDQPDQTQAEWERAVQKVRAWAKPLLEISIKPNSNKPEPPSSTNME